MYMKPITDLLAALSKDRVPPNRAEKRVQELARELRCEIQLLWQHESFDDSFQYDVLVRTPDQDTVSLGFCPEPDTPWPLRGVQRWDDKQLVRVNSIVMAVDEAMALLDLFWNEVRLVRRLVDVCLVREALAKSGIELTDDDLQTALDAFRRTVGLCSAKETHVWMTKHGISEEKLLQYAHNYAAVGKLREHVADGKVTNYFEAHREDFATVRFAYADFDSSYDAEQTAAAIRDGAQTIYDAVAGSFAVSDTESQSCFSSVTRAQAESEGLECLFAARPDELVGPIELAKRWRLAQVVSTDPPVLSDNARERIKDVLFDNWLDEQRGEARVVWYWGNSDESLGC